MASMVIQLIGGVSTNLVEELSELEQNNQWRFETWYQQDKMAPKMAIATIQPGSSNSMNVTNVSRGLLVIPVSHTHHGIGNLNTRL